MKDQKIKRLIYLPSPGHVYNHLFADALSAHGIVEEPAPDFTNASLEDNAARLSGVHFHFVHQLLQGEHLVARTKSLLGMTSYCRLARRRGLKIIWTAHDLPGGGEKAAPKAAVTDDRVRGSVASLAFRYFARISDLVIVHSDAARQRLERKYGALKRVVRMPHGSFAAIYKRTRSRHETLSALGLDPGTPVLGMIGRVNEARGHLLALDAVSALAGKAQLLIAGRAGNREYADRIEEAASGNRYARVAFGRMSEEDYADTVAACDLILLPYTDITTSGALLSAWTLGRTVVMSDLPLFREFLPADAAAGVLVRGRDAKEWVRAITALLDIPEEKRERAALEESGRYAWDRVVEPVARALQRVL